MAGAEIDPKQTVASAGKWDVGVYRKEKIFGLELCLFLINPYASPELRLLVRERVSKI
jgi:hypothetical protein